MKTIKTWQERCNGSYTYPSFEVCQAMEAEIAELHTVHNATTQQLLDAQTLESDTRQTAWEEAAEERARRMQRAWGMREEDIAFRNWYGAQRNMDALLDAGRHSAMYGGAPTDALKRVLDAQNASHYRGWAARHEPAPKPKPSLDMPAFKQGVAKGIIAGLVICAGVGAVYFIGYLWGASK